MWSALIFGLNYRKNYNNVFAVVLTLCLCPTLSHKILTYLKALWIPPCVPGIVVFIYKDIEPLFFKLLWLSLNNLSVDMFANIKAQA